MMASRLNGQFCSQTNSTQIYKTVILLLLISIEIYSSRAEETTNKTAPTISSTTRAGFQLSSDLQTDSIQSDHRFSLGSLFGLQLPSSSTTNNNNNIDIGPAIRCGQRIQTYDQRIVGGRAATIADFPWMVSLQREKGFWFGFRAFYHSCGGSLVTDSWIITAAHCFYNKNDDAATRVVAGTDNMNYLYRAQIRTVEHILVHPEFDSTNYDNDIALIKVSRPFDLVSSFSHIGAICLERDVKLYPYDIATLCGFGAQAFHKKARSHLYRTEIAIIDRDTCNASFSNQITDNMICAGGMVANKRDACSGDSGGPLQMETSDEDNHMSLIGVVSFGNDCALQGFPGIYTKVGNYYNWILDQLDEQLYEP